MNQQVVRNFYVSEVFCDLGGGSHRTANKSDLTAVLVRELHCQLDPVNGGGETGDEKTALGAGEDFIELAADRALAGRIAFALDIGGVLK